MKLLMKSDCAVNACSGGVLDGDPEKLNSSLILGLNVVDILDVYRKSWTASLRHRLVQMQQGSSDFQSDRVTHWVPSDAIARKFDEKWSGNVAPGASCSSKQQVQRSAGRKQAETISHQLVILVILVHCRPHKLQGFQLRTVMRYSPAAFEQSLAEGLLAKDLVQGLATCKLMRNVLQQLQQKD